MNIHARILNYISRYAPSEHKITSYLDRKGIPNSKKLLDEIGYDENLMIDMWIRTFLHTHKWWDEIRRKLLLKGFPREMIDAKIAENLSELHDFDSYRARLTDIVENLLFKGKSMLAIRQKLEKDYPYFRDEIRELLGGFEDSESLEKELEKYKRRYNVQDRNDRQKLIAALMRKGFRYDAIKNILS